MEAPDARAGRSRLPAEAPPRSDFGLLEFVRTCVGKELTRVSMPVTLNEPLTFLQRICEYIEYSELLFQAAATSDPVNRLELVVAFAVSAASSNWARVGKPFNPLLGETFEFDRSSDLGVRMVCEQVSHHPPTSAFHAEAVDGSWLFRGSITPKLSFWGKAVEITPKGHVTLEFPKSGDEYTWQNVQCKLNNVLSGHLWVEHVGELRINSQSSGHVAKLKWHSASRLGPDCHRVDGCIADSRGTKVRALYGRWNGALFSLPADAWKRHKKQKGGGVGQSAQAAGDAGGQSQEAAGDDGDGVVSSSSSSSSSSRLEAAPDAGSGDLRLPGQRRLWRRRRRPADSERFYCFTAFTLQLNDSSDAELMARVAPTDSRLRPDVRAMERGDLGLSQSEKTRLEERQRETGRAGAAPLWFAQQQQQQQQQREWRSTGRYWQRDWSKCPDIF